MKYKRFISVFIISFFITFQIGFVKAHAEAMTASLVLQQSAVQILPKIAPYAPQVALIAACAIGAGIVFHNREEIIAYTSTVLDSLSSKAIEYTGDFTSYISNAYDSIASTFNYIKSHPDYNIKNLVQYEAPAGKYITHFNYSFTNPTTGYSANPSIYMGSLVFLDYSIRLVNGVEYYSLSGIDNNGNFVGFNSFGPVASINVSNIKIKYSDGNVLDLGTSVCPDIPNTIYPDVLNTKDVISIPNTATIPNTLTVEQVADSLVGVNSLPTALDTLGITTGDTTIPVDTPTDTTTDIPKDWSVPSDSVPSINFAPLAISLADKFPFCIPFDFVNSIKSFVAPSEAPKFTVTIPSVFGMQEGSFDIDFANFDKIVKILRFFILATFVYGLIKQTKPLIKG